MRARLIGATALMLISSTVRAGNCPSTTFVEAGRIPTPDQPTANATADFNHDGHLDLVSVSPYQGATVFLGAGDGSFGPPIASTDSYNASYFIVAGKFDADANPDLAIATGGGGIEILLGNGDGTFQPPAFVASGYYPAGLVAADVTGDGILDLIEGLTDPPAIVILPGIGDGTFGPPISLPTLGAPFDVTTGDFDDDGHLDIAATLSSNSVEVFPGTGGGAFGSPSAIKVGNNLGPIVAGDFNDDGNLDLALGVANYVAVLRGNGDGTFRAALEYASQVAVNRLAAADLDGDGKTDLVALRAVPYYYGLAGVLAPFLQQPDGSLSSAASSLAGVGSVTLTTGDFNEDGLPDFSTADSGSDSLSVILGEAQGRLVAPTYLSLQTQANILVPGDFTGDGHVDLAVLGSNYDGPLQIVQFLDGLATVGPIIELDSYPQGAAAADFNGDGNLDLVIAGGYGSLRILFGNGDGTFQPAIPYSTGSNTYLVVAGDFTGDGIPDVAFAERSFSSQPEVATLINDGTGNFLPGPVTPLVTDISSLVAAHFDAGPTLDLAGSNCCNPQANTVLVLLGAGDGTFQAPSNYPTGPGPAGVAVGDFNGDDAPDLAVADASASNVSILINDGAGGFQAPVLVGIGWTPMGITVGDFDVDGKADVATVNPSSYNVTLLRGVGDGTFQAPVIYPAPNTTQAIVAVNFGGLGPDLAIAAPGDLALELLVNAHLSVQPLIPTSVLVGTRALLIASASGVGPLSYQWSRNGVPLSDGGSILGAQTAILTIDPVSFADRATYSVLVTDACASVASNAAELFVEFEDVPLASAFHGDIITIATAGITAGCGGPDYCPTVAVRRDQMAVFLLKAEHGSAYIPPPCTGIFADVPCPGPFADWIERLAAEGVTGGCGNGDFCPGQTVTRAQMAVFLLKTSQGSAYVPPPATGIFGDVPAGSFAADFIEDLYTRGITGGCQSSPLLYCPASSVLRQQMATFVVRMLIP